MSATPAKSGLKRELSFSPSDISPSQIQTEKAAKTQPDSPIFKTSAMSQHTAQANPGDTVLQLSDAVCAVINNPQFVNAIVPMVLEKVLETIQPHVEEMIAKSIQPYIEAIDKSKEELKSQNAIIIKQREAISKLQDKVTGIGRRVEAQEQYSRRTSLRFNNVQVPTKHNGDIIQPIDTDKVVLQICNEQLGLNLTVNDLGRTHPIGEIKHGKASIIVRFLTYRQRQWVFNNKKKLKQHPDKLFITENLTRYRYGLLKQLNSLRFAERIHSFWTHDGKIIVKETDNSGFKVIHCNQDIRDLGGEISEEDDDF